MPDIVRLFAVYLSLLLLSSTASQATEVTAEAVVRQTTEQIYGAIQKDQQLISQNPEHLFLLVEEVLLPHADFQRMSKWVLGKYWRVSSETQRQQFAREFRTLLVRTYSAAIEEAAPEEIHYLPNRSTGDVNKAVVRTEVRRPGETALPIQYYMHRNKSRWLVYDIRVEGISLVANYRSTFASEIKLKGVQGLIDTLKQQNRRRTVADS